MEHEAAYLAHLKTTQGLDHERVGEDLDSDIALESTEDLMRTGAPIIVQAALAHGRWRGRADVLLKVPAPSRLGDWHYTVIDTKLARTTKGETILQLCLYADLLSHIQGTLPGHFGVVTPKHRLRARVVPHRKFHGLFSPRSETAARQCRRRHRHLSRTCVPVRAMPLVAGLRSHVEKR